VDTILELRRYDTNDLKCCKRVITAYGRHDDTPPEVVIELHKATRQYRALGDKKDARREEKTAGDRAIRGKIKQLLPTERRGMTGQAIEGARGDDKFPRKEALLKILTEGVESGEWTRQGEGTKGKPHTFFRTPASPDSVHAP